MQYAQRTLLALSMIVSLLLAGCSSEPGADTPREAMEQFMRSQVSNDSEQALAVVKASDARKQLLEASMKASEARLKFHDALVKEYGAHSVEQFGLWPRDTIKVSEEYVETNLQKMQIETSEDGATATATVDGHADRAHLVQEAGRWYLDLSNQMQGVSEDELRRMAAERNKLATVIADNMDQIDADRQSINELFQKIGNDLYGGDEPARTPPDQQDTPSAEELPTPDELPAPPNQSNGQ